MRTAIIWGSVSPGLSIQIDLENHGMGVNAGMILLNSAPPLILLRRDFGELVCAQWYYTVAGGSSVVVGTGRKEGNMADRSRAVASRLMDAILRLHAGGCVP